MSGDWRIDPPPYFSSILSNFLPIFFLFHTRCHTGWHILSFLLSLLCFLHKPHVTCTHGSRLSFSSFLLLAFHPHRLCVLSLFFIHFFFGSPSQFPSPCLFPTLTALSTPCPCLPSRSRCLPIIHKPNKYKYHDCIISAPYHYNHYCILHLHLLKFPLPPISVPNRPSTVSSFSKAFYTNASMTCFHSQLSFQPCQPCPPFPSPST